MTTSNSIEGINLALFVVEDGDGLVSDAVAYRIASDEGRERRLFGVGIGGTKGAISESSFMYDEGSGVLLLGDLSETWLTRVENGKKVAFDARPWTSDETALLDSCRTRIDSLVSESEDRLYLTEDGEDALGAGEGPYTEGDFDPEDLESVCGHWSLSLTWDFD